VHGAPCVVTGSHLPGILPVIYLGVVFQMWLLQSVGMGVAISECGSGLPATGRDSTPSCSSPIFASPFPFQISLCLHGVPLGSE
jgi:hypothetical protein